MYFIRRKKKKLQIFISFFFEYSVVVLVTLYGCRHNKNMCNVRVSVSIVVLWVTLNIYWSGSIKSLQDVRDKVVPVYLQDVDT